MCTGCLLSIGSGKTVKSDPLTVCVGLIYKFVSGKITARLLEIGLPEEEPQLPPKVADSE